MFYKRGLTMLLSVAGMAAVGNVAKANNPIVSTIENAKSGQTVNVSGTYTGISTTITVPSGVTVTGPATFEFTTGASADGFYVPSGNSGVKLNSLTVEGANHAQHHDLRFFLHHPEFVYFGKQPEYRDRNHRQQRQE